MVGNPIQVNALARLANQLRVRESALSFLDAVHSTTDIMRQPLIETFTHYGLHGHTIKC